MLHETDISDLWEDRLVTTPSDAVYDPDSYLVLPEDSSCMGDGSEEDIIELFERHHAVLATPVSELSAMRTHQLKSVLSSQSEVNSLNELIGFSPEDAIKTVLFANRNDPDDWVGLVSFDARLKFGEATRLDVRHLITFVFPEYRGLCWQPVLTAMCGELINRNLRENLLWRNPNILMTKSIALKVTAKGMFSNSAYLLESFAAAVAGSLDGYQEFDEYMEDLVREGELSHPVPIPRFKYKGPELEPLLTHEAEVVSGLDMEQSANEEDIENTFEKSDTENEDLLAHVTDLVAEPMPGNLADGPDDKDSLAENQSDDAAVAITKIKLKVISGGQTGVDRAALDAALEAGVATGGWCPKGRKAEDGVIPKAYPLKELSSASYKKRTRKNVVKSDGTAIIYFGYLSGGTEKTLAFCMEENKPYVLIDAEEVSINRAAEKILAFVREKKISVLNLAGPRASGEPGAYDYTKHVMRGALEACK